jgi:hypothetical protein
VSPIDPIEVERRLADVDRQLRRLADLMGPSGLGPANAVASSDTDEGHDIADLHTDAILARLGRLSTALDAMAPGDAGEMPIMRLLLSELSVLAAMFRRRGAAVVRSLDTSAADLGPARRAVIAYRELDRTSTP